MVERAVVRVAVVVSLAIRLVVLLVIGNEVMQREAVMRGDEIDTGPGLAAAAVEQTGGAGEPGGEVGDLAGVALPVTPDRIAGTFVPFGPAGREMANLI